MKKNKIGRIIDKRDKDGEGMTISVGFLMWKGIYLVVCPECGGHLIANLTEHSTKCVDCCFWSNLKVGSKSGVIGVTEDTSGSYESAANN